MGAGGDFETNSLRVGTVDDLAISRFQQDPTAAFEGEIGIKIVELAFASDHQARLSIGKVLGNIVAIGIDRKRHSDEFSTEQELVPVNIPIAAENGVYFGVIAKPSECGIVERSANWTAHVIDPAEATIP